MNTATADATATTTKKAPTEVKTVTMDDGKIVEFTGKKRLVKDASISQEAIAIRMDFVNGEVRSFELPFTNTKLLYLAAAHGLSQKFGDETAGLNTEDSVEAVTELLERLGKGDWNTPRGEGIAGSSVLAQALAELRSKPIDVIKAFLKTKTPAEKNALRANPAVKPIVDRIEAAKAEKAGKKVDSDALLAGLD